MKKNVSFEHQNPQKLSEQVQTDIHGVTWWD